MSCGHVFTFREITNLKEKCLQEGISDIRCPFVAEGIKCNQPWAAKELKVPAKY